MRTGVLVRLFILGVIIFVGLWFWLKPEPQPETPIIKFIDRPLKTNFETALKVGELNYLCSGGECLPRGENNNANALEYFYDNSNADKETDKVFLKQKDLVSGEIKTIMESTPLTSPRGLFLSHNKKHLAFWLDNVDEPSKKLTELWALNTETGSIRLLAEKLFVPDIKAEPQWNAADSKIFFVADTGEQDEAENLELIVVGLEPTVRADFASKQWFDKILADINFDGDKAAYTSPSFFKGTVLRILSGQDESKTSIRDNIIFLEWLNADELIYAVQSGNGVTLWLASNGVHRFLARRPGILQSAKLSDSAEYLITAINNGSNKSEVISIHLKSGTAITEGAVLSNTNEVAIASVVSSGDIAENNNSVLAANKLDDAELAAFLDKNLDLITGNKIPEPISFVVSSQTNTVFLVFRDDNDLEQRVLLTVNSALHADWAIKGRYSAVRGQWQKAQGGGLPDPEPLRLYEWEKGLQQWILKQQLTHDN